MALYTAFYIADCGVRILPGKLTDLWWPVYEKQADGPDCIVAVCPSEAAAARVLAALLGSVMTYEPQRPAR